MVTLELAPDEGKAWYFEKSRKVNHEGRWLKIFQLDGEESTHLKKEKEKRQRVRQPKRGSKKSP